MRRRSGLVAIICAVLLGGIFSGLAQAADPPALPASIAAVGDSITQAASSGGSLGTDYPQNSWATGTNSTVNSHYLRLLALNPAISGQSFNRSVSGAKVVDLNGQMQQVAGLHPDYVTVLIGGNDLCTDTVDQMTSVASFRSEFTTAMDTLTAGSPTTNVLVVSIPRVYHLWEIFKGSFWARFIWAAGDICQSLLANPQSTNTTDVARRAVVAQRNVDFNTQLAQVCAAYIRCRFDGNAVYNTEFTTADASGDYFHPSISGQAKLARVAWEAGYWSAPPPKTVSIADLSGSTATRKSGWTATITVTVADSANAAVFAATVSGSWSTGSSGGCTTAASGRCSFSLNVGRKAASVSWTVSGITHATLTYDPQRNQQSTVTLARP